MNFSVGDTILYGTNGVCKITDITEEKFNYETHKYYVLKPVFDENATVYIPFDNEKLISKMKRIISEEEINELIKSLKGKEIEWIDNENKRKEKFKNIIYNGDREELMILIRTIYLHQEDLVKNGKKLHIMDERFLKDAEKLIYDEFSLVLNINREDVVPFILERM